MPILDVEIVLPAGDEPPPGMAAALADAAAGVFRAPPGHTWVRLRVLPGERYAEDGGGPDAGIQPVFVHVFRGAVPTGTELETEVAALTAAVARVCRRPVENVHILYDPPVAGRIAFGGRLLEDAGPHP